MSFASAGYSSGVINSIKLLVNFIWLFRLDITFLAYLILIIICYVISEYSSKC